MKGSTHIFSPPVHSSSISSETWFSTIFSYFFATFLLCAIARKWLCAFSGYHKSLGRMNRTGLFFSNTCCQLHGSLEAIPFHCAPFFSPLFFSILVFFQEESRCRKQRNSTRIACKSDFLRVGYLSHTVRRMRDENPDQSVWLVKWVQPNIIVLKMIISHFLIIAFVNVQLNDSFLKTQ